MIKSRSRRVIIASRKKGREDHKLSAAPHRSGRSHRLQIFQWLPQNLPVHLDRATSSRSRHASCPLQIDFSHHPVTYSDITHAHVPIPKGSMKNRNLIAAILLALTGAAALSQEVPSTLPSKNRQYHSAAPALGYRWLFHIEGKHYKATISHDEVKAGPD